MNNKILFILIILLALGFQSVFAQEAEDTAVVGEASTAGGEVPAMDKEFVQSTHPNGEAVEADSETGIAAETDAAVETEAETGIASETESAVETDVELAADTDTEGEVPVTTTSSSIAADEGEEAETEVATETGTSTETGTAIAAETDSNIPITIRNNQYYRESLRLTELAKSTYDEGDYDVSSDHAEEAIRQAELSDEFVAQQLKRRAANKAITTAKQRLDWANTSGAAKQHPDEYSSARSYYDASLTARSAGQWEEAYDSANRVLEILALFEAPAGSLPAQYTVRPWVSTKDCLWNIAGQPWVYNDPFKWKLLYDANKSKLPEPNNPDLIEPSMVLTIPSLKGEARQGMYDPAKNYTPIK